MLRCAYYSLGHFMSKMDKWPTRAQNPGAAWLSLLATVFASTTLFKLAPPLKNMGENKGVNDAGWCGKIRYLVSIPSLSSLVVHC